MPSFNTVQEAMDFAVQKIVEQGAKCGDSSGCVYEYDDMHCAVGWLIAPTDDDSPEAWEAYDEILEHLWDSSIDTVMNYVEENEVHKLRHLPNFQLIADNTPLFSLLQNFHDVGTTEERRSAMHVLSEHGIDTSGNHWQDWLTIDVED